MKTARRRARILLDAFLRHKVRFTAGVLLLLATNGLALTIPWMLKVAVDAVKSGAPSSRVALLATVIGAIAIVQAIVRTLSRVAILGASRHIVYELRNRFFAHLIALPAPFFDRYRTGDLMSRAVNDLLLIRSFFGPGILNLANTVLSWTGAVVLMAAIDLRLTLWSLIPYPFVLIAMNRLSRALYLGSTRAQEQLAVLSSRAQENLSGIAQVKAYDLGRQEITDFAKLAAELRRRNLYLARVRGAVVPLMGSVGGIGTLLVLWLGARHLITGAITIGEFVAFNAYLASLAWPTIAMGWILNVFQRSRGAIDRISEILEAELPTYPGAVPDLGGLGEVALSPDVHSQASRGLGTSMPTLSARRVGPVGAWREHGADRTSSRDPGHGNGAQEPLGGERARTTDPAGGGQTEQARSSSAAREDAEILVEDLSFTYEGTSKPALRDVSFRLPPGKVLGVVGPVGSGKTTLLRLLARLYPAPSAAIRVAGRELSTLDEGILRRLIGVVPQESFLFSMTLAENIALGRPDASRLEIEEAGRKAGLTADLADLPRGYDTPVGERGYTLSGGQRQRVALARALLVDPAVLLLDDPFASVDASTETEILAELAARATGTRIVSGHRISAVQDADEILVLQDGLVIERGTHPDLLAAGGLYQRMFERQQTETEIERA